MADHERAHNGLGPAQWMCDNLDTAARKDGWLIFSPGGGGCLHTLTVSPHRPGTVVASCDMTAGYITHDGGASWRQFNLKSRQYAYAFHPNQPDVIYVGSSGLFRSDDQGSTWRLVFPDPASVYGETRLFDEARHTFLSHDNWPGGSIHAILLDPGCPERIYLVIKKDSLRIFSSTNAGQHWEETVALPGSDIHCLYLDTSTPTSARSLYAFTDAGLYHIQTGSARANQLPLPEEILTVRSGAWGAGPASGECVFYLTGLTRTGGGVWKSTDRGGTWSRCTQGLVSPVAPVEAADLVSFSQVSACAKDGRRAYLIAENFPDLEAGSVRVDRYGILTTGDEGRTWTWVVQMDDDHDPQNRAGGWAERDYGAAWGDIQGEEQISPKGRFAWDVAASPVDPLTCYTMDFSTIFKTQDGGATWQQLCTHVYPDGSVSSRGIDVLSAYGVMFDPFDPQHIALALTDVGVFHSSNQGRTWRHALAGVPRAWINTCYWMVFDPDVKGRAWSAWAGMHDIPRLKMFRDELFAKYQGGICRTEDGLETWQVSAQGLPERSLPTHLLLDPSSPAGKRTLYAAVFGQGVYKSTDDGHSWKPSSAGIDPRNLFAWRLARLPGGELYLVVVKNQLPGRARTGAIYRSTDGAARWESLPLPDGVSFPNDLTFDASQPQRLYLACWPETRDGQPSGGGMYASDDGGTSWKCLFDPAAHVYTVSTDPACPTTLYLSTFDAAVYRSDDRGESWRRLKGFNFQWGQRPVPDPHHPGWLYLTTFGSSVWYGPAQGVETALEDIVWEAAPGSDF